MVSWKWIVAATGVAVGAGALLVSLTIKSPRTPGGASASGERARAVPSSVAPEVFQQPERVGVGAANTETIVVKFPDGSSHTVARRQRPEPREIAAERLIDVYGQLRHAAEAGDGSAAEALYRALDHCKKAYLDEQSLAKALDVLRKEKKIRLADGSPEIAVDSTDDPGALGEDFLRRPFEYCKGITDEQRQASTDWLKLAARSGDIYAMRVNAGLMGRTAEAMHTWEAAWRKGDRVALEFLGMIHYKGLQGTEGDEVNLVLAYAYKLLNVRLLEASYGDLPAGLPGRMLLHLRADLAEASGALDPQETVQAVETAKRLLADNPNCCYLM